MNVCVCLYSRHSRNSTSSSNYMSERTTSSIGALKTSKTSRFAATPPPSPHHVVCSTGNFDSVADSACLCGIGFTGPGDGVCTKCAKGSYKGTNGSDACTSCLHGKYSTANAAMGAETCQNCAVGTYLRTMGNYAATDWCHAPRVRTLRLKGQQMPAHVWNASRAHSQTLLDPRALLVPPNTVLEIAVAK